jgi:hypothetical protein
MFQTKILKKVTTHFVCSFFSSSSFPSENRAVYEVMWKNIVEPVGPQMT